MTGIATIVDQVLGRSIIPPGARPVTPPQARFDVPQAAAPRSKKRPAPKSNRFRIRGFVTAAFDAGTPMSITEIAQVCGASYRQVHRHVRDLVEEGRVIEWEPRGAHAPALYRRREGR